MRRLVTSAGSGDQGDGDGDGTMARARVSIQHCLTGDGSELTDVEVECPRCHHTLSLDTRTPPSVERRLAHRSVARASGHAAPGEPSVADVMSREVLCVRVDTAVGDVRRLLLERNLGGAPVIDALGKPVGVICKTDMVRDALDTIEEEPVDPRLPRGQGLEHGYHAERLPRSTVGEIMTPHAFTLPVDAPLSRAAALMAYQGVHLVIITNHDGHVAGVVSALDVTRWYAQSQGLVVVEPARRAPTFHWD